MSRLLTFGIKLLCGLSIVAIVFIGLFVMPAMASDRFVDHDDGTVTDTKTGLMWAAKDNGNLINWQTARSYCQNYNGGGHTDWRIPTLTELASLYDPKEKNKHGYHVNRLVGLQTSVTTRLPDSISHTAKCIGSGSPTQVLAGSCRYEAANKQTGFLF